MIEFGKLQNYWKISLTRLKYLTDSKYPILLYPKSISGIARDRQIFHNIYSLNIVRLFQPTFQAP